MQFDKLLTNLGYSTESYFPRFWRGESGVPIPRHRVIAVKIQGEKYITDVGIGSAAPRVPLLLCEGLVQESYGESYRFCRSHTAKATVLCATKNTAGCFMN